MDEKKIDTSMAAIKDTLSLLEEGFTARAFRIIPALAAERDALQAKLTTAEERVRELENALLAAAGRSRESFARIAELERELHDAQEQ